MTVSNSLENLTGDGVASSLTAYGSVEDVAQLQSIAVTAHGDYMFRIFLDWEGFLDIQTPSILRKADDSVDRGKAAALLWLRAGRPPGKRFPNKSSKSGGDRSAAKTISKSSPESSFIGGKRAKHWEQLESGHAKEEKYSQPSPPQKNNPTNTPIIINPNNAPNKNKANALIQNSFIKNSPYNTSIMKNPNHTPWWKIPTATLR